MHLDDYEFDCTDEYRKPALRSHQTNELLIRRIGGRVKLATHRLPPPGFTYGSPPLEKEEGAGSIIHNWTSNLELVPQDLRTRPVRDYVQLNRSAARQNVDAAHYKAFKDQYLQQAAMPPWQTQSMQSKRIGVLDNDMVYGTPSGERQSMTDVMTYQYQRDFLAQRRKEVAEEEQKRLTQKGVLRASRQSLIRPKPAPEEPRPMFKMAQFQNVPSKTVTRRAASAPPVTRHVTMRESDYGNGAEMHL